MSSHRRNLAICALVISIYALFVFRLYGACKFDPTSPFFDANIAYQARYSNIRKEKALRFVQDLDSPFRRNASEPSPPFLCVGMPSIMRNHSQYFHYAVGSLFDGLSDDERQEISFLVLIANAVPQGHYAYQQRWLEQVADSVFEYNETTPGYDHLLDLEDRKDYWIKGLLDYTAILESCVDTRAPYVLIVEDDVLALDGWYVRTKEALQALKSQNMYLRLFYAEEFLGWQSERALAYLAWALAITAVATFLAFRLRSAVPKLKRILSRQTLLIVCVTNCAAIIALCFAAGRLSIFPLENGVVRMDNGCCGQSLVFARETIPQLVEYFRSVKDGHADRRIEEYAQYANLAPLALVPSVFQHIGSKTSHEADRPEDNRGGFTLAERVMNIEFERNPCKS